MFVGNFTAKYLIGAAVQHEVIALGNMHELVEMPMRDGSPRRDGTLDWLFHAREHWSEAKLAERERNRKTYFDTKYPDRRIFLVGE